MNKRGRPTKRVEAVVKRLCDAIREGMPYGPALAIAGISHQTFCEWRKHFPEFRESVLKAEAEGMQAQIALLTKASKKGDVGAAKWLLANRYPQYFSSSRPPENLERELADDGVTSEAFEPMSHEQREEIMDKFVACRLRYKEHLEKLRSKEGEE